jgi:hypothetical protein
MICFIANFFHLYAFWILRLINIACKWWPLQHRIGWHTSGNRVNTLLFVTCFSSDEMT